MSRLTRLTFSTGAHAEGLWTRFRGRKPDLREPRIPDEVVCFLPLHHRDPKRVWGGR